MARTSCRAKAPRFGAGDGDPHGCRDFLEDVVEALLSMSRFRVKTSIRLDSAAATLCVVLPVEGVAVELRCVRVLCGWLVLSMLPDVRAPACADYSRISFVRGLPHHLVSFGRVPCSGPLSIKGGESLFSERLLNCVATDIIAHFFPHKSGTFSSFDMAKLCCCMNRENLIVMLLILITGNKTEKCYNVCLLNEWQFSRCFWHI